MSSCVLPQCNDLNSRSNTGSAANSKVKQRKLHGCNDCNNPECDNLNCNIICRYVRKDGMKSRIELTSSKSKTGANSKQSCKDGKDVNQVSDPTKDSVSKDRVEAGFHGHWKILSECHKAE